MSNKLIYLDNAATTRVREEVVEAMIPYYTQEYGNASTVYSFAQGAKQALDHSRDIMAGILGCKSNEIYFTGCGSESDNWALKATAEAYKARVTISLLLRSSITPSCTPVIGWRRMVWK